MRKISIFSSQGAGNKDFNSAATTWGEFRPILAAAGYDLDNLHALENARRTNLESDEAVLPTGDFTIFLKPRKTKSGQ